MMRVQNHPDVDDPRCVFVTEYGCGALLDASDFLALAGEDAAAQEMKALGRKLLDLENALSHDRGGPPDSWACITVSAADAADALRLLTLLYRVETKVISGDFRLLPEHVPRARHELAGLGIDEGGEPPRISVWREYQEVYKTMALLEGAAEDGRAVEICSFRLADDDDE